MVLHEWYWSLSNPIINVIFTFFFQHVERPDHNGQPDVPPDMAHNAVSALVSDSGRQPTNLRDEVNNL